MSPGEKAQVAYMLGALAGLHNAAKNLEDAGVEQMDMVCCGLEDLATVLRPLLGDVGEAESMSMNS